MHAAIARAEWVPDSSVVACEQCTKKFNQYRRKHHCRHCGHVFCWECSKLKYDLLVPAKNGGFKKETQRERVCDACYDTQYRIAYAHALRGNDPHGDCRNYCRGNEGARRGNARRQLGGTFGNSGGSSWAKLFAALGGGDGAAAAGASVEQQDAPAAQANHVKTEF